MSLVARADLDFPVALFALDEAAPVELALAPLHPLLSPGGVAPHAAHQLAPVNPRAPLQRSKTVLLANSHHFGSVQPKK